MRPATLQIILAVVLPLAAFAQTNQWEAQGDSLLLLRPDLAVGLYAKSLLADGATVMQLHSNVEQEPYLVAMERVLEKLPWYKADAKEFKKLFHALGPVLKKEFKKQRRKEIRKSLVNKYRLVREDTDAEDDFADASVVTNIVTLSVVGLDVIEAGAIMLDSVGLDSVTMLDPTDLSSIIAAYDLAFTIMGQDGLFIPHPNSPLGWKYKALKKKLDTAGGNWTDDPTLVAEWERYWIAVKGGLARRARMQLRLRR